MGRMSDSRLEFTRFEYQVAMTNVSARFLRFGKMFRTHVCGFVNPNIYNSSYWNGLCHGDYGISVMSWQTWTLQLLLFTVYAFRMMIEESWWRGCENTLRVELGQPFQILDIRFCFNKIIIRQNNYCRLKTIILTNQNLKGRSVKCRYVRRVSLR